MLVEILAIIAIIVVMALIIVFPIRYSVNKRRQRLKELEKLLSEQRTIVRIDGVGSQAALWVPVVVVVAVFGLTSVPGLPFELGKLIAVAICTALMIAARRTTSICSRCRQRVPKSAQQCPTCGRFEGEIESG